MTAAATGPGDLGLLTIAELAAAFRVCERTIERRIGAGLFPVVQVAGGRRVPRSWVTDLIAAAIASGKVVAEDHGRAWIAANRGAR